MLVGVAAVLITVAVVVGKWLYKEYSAALANGQATLATAPVLNMVATVPNQASVAPIRGTEQVATDNDTLVAVTSVDPVGLGPAVDDVSVSVDENAGESLADYTAAQGGEVDGENNDAAQYISAVTPLASDALELIFTQESWVKVVDGSGTVLVMTQKSAGTQLSLQGQPPFSLILGNAPGVTVNYRGESVPVTDLNPQTRAARLVVGQ